MGIALLIGLGTLLVGTALAFLSTRNASWIGGAQTFALVASVAVVVVHLLPEALYARGVVALLGFAAGLLGPTLLERCLGHRHAHRPGEAGATLGFELGYAGFLLHAMSDGVALWFCSPPRQAAPDVLFALAAHAVPITAVVVLHVLVSSGAKAALCRALGLAVALAIGVVSAEALPEAWLSAVEPWLNAILGGLLLHIVLHQRLMLRVAMKAGK